MEASNVDAWAQTTDVNLAALDAMVAEMVELRKAHKAKKDEAAQAYAKVEEIEAKISSVLQASGKSKYFVDGLGTAYIINKHVVTTPKSNEAKEALFKYIEEKYGREVLTSKLSIVHASLNAFYNEEVAALAKEGKVAEIPGIEAPTHEINLGFRKE